MAGRYGETNFRKHSAASAGHDEGRRPGERQGPDRNSEGRRGKGPDAVQSKAPIQTTGVSSVGQVGGSAKGDRSQRIRSGTRPLTQAERQYLLELVAEEAEKMFGDGKVSPKKRQIIESSVRMTLAAGTAEDDDDELP